MAEQKSEKPTQRRLEKARKEGNFVASREFVAAGQFIVFIGLSAAYFGNWMSGMKQMVRQSLERAFHSEVTSTALPGMFWTLIQQSAIPLAVLAGLAAATTLGLQLAITKAGLSLNKLTPDFKRLNPVSKIKRIVQQAPMQVLEAVMMLCLFGSTLYYMAQQNAALFLSLPFASLDLGLQTIGTSLKQLLWKGAGLFLVFGVVDLFRQQRRLMKDLRMSKQELRDESKETEGHPQVRQRIRRLRRDLAR